MGAAASCAESLAAARAAAAPSERSLSRSAASVASSLERDASPAARPLSISLVLRDEIARAYLHTAFGP